MDSNDGCGRETEQAGGRDSLSGDISGDRLKKKKKRTAGRLIFIIAALAVVAGCAVFGIYKGFYDPYRHMARSTVPTKPLDQTLTAEQAAEDMKYIYDRVSETHPIWVDGSDSLVAAFDEAYSVQCEYLAAMGDSVTVLDEWRSAAALLAVLGDAHTYSNARPDKEPVLCIESSDELSDEARLVAVGGSSTDTLYSSFKTMCSYESEAWALNCFKKAVVREPWLRALGTDTSGEIIYEYADGKSIKQTVCRFYPPEEAAVRMEADDPVQEEEPPFCRYVIDARENVGVFTLSECDYNEQYRETLESFFEEVRAQDIGNVIVDLRDNPGGNSYVANEFISYLDTESFVPFGGVDVRLGGMLRRYDSERVTVVPKKNTFSGGVYVLTSSGTFSAGVDFAVMIADNGLGTIVGETPGGMPSSYGDIVVFQTKNAGVLFQVSYKYFHRIDSSKDRLALTPDVECEAGEAYDRAIEMIRG